MNQDTTPESTASPGALATAGDTSHVFSGLAAFETANRMAKALCSSTLVPSVYQGQSGLANCLIALEIAGRMRLSPYVVMQNMVPIHGKPTWSSSFLIGTVNASGRFSPLRFQFDSEDNPTWCYAEATERASGELLKGQKITIEMAKKEGWWNRSGSKWPSLTGQMLMYRAASFWQRVYCPEISLGLITQEEALDVATVEDVTAQEAPGPAVPQPIQAEPVEVVEAVEAVEPQAPQPPAREAAKPARAAATPRRQVPLQDMPGLDLVAQVLAECQRAGFTDEGITEFCRRLSEKKSTNLEELPQETLQKILRNGISTITAHACNSAHACDG